MFNVKISVPTYRLNTWGHLDKQGEVELSAEVDALSDGYAALKEQVDELLAQVKAENRVVTELGTINSEIDKSQKTLRRLNERIDAAKSQLERLEKFLRRLGIDPNSYSLDINSNPALDAAIDEPAVAVEVETYPIPFDSETETDSDSSEF